MRQRVQVLLTQLCNVARQTKMGIMLVSDFILSFLATGFACFVVGDVTLNTSMLVWVSCGVACFRVAMFTVFGLYSYSWRFASTRQFKFMYGVLLVGSGVLAVVFYSGNGFGIERSILPVFVLLEWMGVMCVLFSSRGCMRVLRDELLMLTKRNMNTSTVPVLVVGAGAAGAMLASESLKNPHIKYEIKGFLDDDIRKIGQRIHGFRVKGSVSDLKKIALKEGVTDIVIAIPSATSSHIRNLISDTAHKDLRFKITPSLHDLMGDKVSLTELRDIRIQDLLGRDEVEQMIIDEQNNYIQGKTVCVTGGGGSIGSELCVQMLKFQPKRLVVLDNCEDHVYQIDRKLRALYPNVEGLKCVVGDVGCEADMKRVFESERIEVVFHQRRNIVLH
jgi:FlaA1/EpsC-like NDP-sugar epimerase